MTRTSLYPPDALRARHGQPPPQAPSRAAAARGVLIGAVLLAVAPVIAVSAQQATTGGGAGEAPAKEEQAGPQTEASGSMPSSSEPSEPAAAPEAGEMVEGPAGAYAASEMIGQPVITAEGEEAGEIVDLLVSDDNRVTGVVVGLGGFLGFGEKRVEVEMDRLDLMPTGEGGAQLLLDYTRADLEQAPAFVPLAERRREEARRQGAADGEQPANEAPSPAE
ncbi:MAG: PRC-barrel domain-containing protein [Pseudomonadota bacterium]